MPPSKLKPSDIAVEAKKTYIPYVNQRFSNLPARSHLHSNAEKMVVSNDKRSSSRKLRIAIIDGDPVDVALDWDEYEAGRSSGERPRIAVVNMANERIPGGDWESGLLAPEENFCRRSNLVQCLAHPWSPSLSSATNYPLPLRGGTYAPSVVVYRSGPSQNYEVWSDFKWIPVVSVAPVRRPKLDQTGDNYSFAQEKELMKDKIRAVLRIAATYNHHDLCVGAFGAGPTFRNPVAQLARMWRDVLFNEAEFQGAFTNVVFAIEKSSAPTASSNPSDYDIFKQEFDASNVCRTTYR